MSAGETTVDVRDVIRGLDAMKRRGADLRPVWRELRPELRKHLKQHFADREGTDGSWPGPAASTIEHAARAKDRLKRKPGLTKRGQRRLQNIGSLGRLKSAWGFDVNRRNLVAFSLVPWAGIHQHGGTAGHGARIPARTFAWAASEFIARARERLAKFVAEAF